MAASDGAAYLQLNGNAAGDDLVDENVYLFGGLGQNADAADVSDDVDGNGRFNPKRHLTQIDHRPEILAAHLAHK